MMQRLPKGEETLPVIEVGGELLTPAGLERAHPELCLDKLWEPASTRLLMVATVLTDIAAIEHSIHTRWRVYPQSVSSTALLVADAAYMFTVPWRTGDSINIRYSVTAGTIKRLLIDEIGGAE